MKLRDIAQGWVNFIIQPDDLKELGRTRLEICDSCPHKKQMNSLGAMLVGAINEQGSTYLCGLCGCPLAAKSVSSGSECPLGKWPTLDRSSY
jgi:hypothetical protein